MNPRMAKKEKMDHFIRLGMTESFRLRVERWRAQQLEKTGKVPSFSDAVRQLAEQTLEKDGH